MIVSQSQTENSIEIHLTDGRIFRRVTDDVLPLIDEHGLETAILVFKEEIRNFFYSSTQDGEERYYLNPDCFTVLFDENGVFTELTFQNLWQ